MRPDDPHNLARFIDAQARVYQSVLAELARGRKTGHWMWYVFPQLSGLGSSATARKYSIAGLNEARAYLGHPVLGARLRQCTALVVELEGQTAGAIFGHPDDLKFRSCMTLFAHVRGDNREFAAALAKYFDGVPDPLTEQLLGKA